MTDQSRLVRDLLDANLQLTQQLIELTRIAIGAPVVMSIEGAPMNEDAATGLVPAPEFTLSTDDDWEDIPDSPMGGGATILEIPRRSDPVELPLHMTEEEEDLRHEVAMGLKPSTDLSDLLTRLGTPGSDAFIEFTVPEA